MKDKKAQQKYEGYSLGKVNPQKQKIYRKLGPKSLPLHFCFDYSYPIEKTTVEIKRNTIDQEKTNLAICPTF